MTEKGTVKARNINEEVMGRIDELEDKLITFVKKFVSFPEAMAHINDFISAEIGGVDAGDVKLALRTRYDEIVREYFESLRLEYERLVIRAFQ